VIDEAQRVGAKHVSLLMNLCMDSGSDYEVRWCDQKRDWLRAKSLRDELSSRGMSVNLIPFLWAKGEKTRQNIWPNKRRLWLKNYGDRMVELAGLAKELNSSDFIVGSELSRLFQVTSEWKSLIARVRKVYAGHITISSFFLQYPFICFWDDLDSIGISSYFPLTWHGDLSSLDALVAGMKSHRSHLIAFAKAKKKPLTFVEVGSPATHVAATRPWDLEWSKRKADFELQARCFAAFREVWGGEKRRRAFQNWGLSAQPTEPSMGFSPIGK
jgi:hypothetical protein